MLHSVFFARLPISHTTGREGPDDPILSRAQAHLSAVDHEDIVCPDVAVADAELVNGGQGRTGALRQVADPQQSTVSAFTIAVESFRTACAHCNTSTIDDTTPTGAVPVALCMQEPSFDC